MNGQWTLPIKPTINSSDDKAVHDSFIELFPEFRKLTNDEFTIDQIKGLTTELIHKQSYCPSTWTSRAYNLLRLGFPDLAIGDAYKATLLLDRYVSGPEGTFKVEVTKQLWRQIQESRPLRAASKEIGVDKAVRMRDYAKFVEDRASLILAQALFTAQCYTECFEFLKGYQPKQFPSNDKFPKLKDLAERAQMIEDLARMQENQYVHQMDTASLETRRSGSILPQCYPWSEPYLRRNQITLSWLRKYLAAKNVDKCRVEPSTIIDSTAMDSQVEKELGTLGLKATKDCEPGELLFTDNTYFSGIDNYSNHCSNCRKILNHEESKIFSAPCCEVDYCGEACMVEAKNYYHPVMCEKPQYVRDEESLLLDGPNVSSGTRATSELLYRLFAHLECYPMFHPLQKNFMAAMIPAYRNARPVPFSWLNDIKRPFMMLNLLNVNIFKDHGTDTWVIQTILARLRNNVREHEDEFGRYHVALNAIFTFLNHSCDPNVEVEHPDGGNTTLRAIATKKITSGEELCISYLCSEALDLPYEERQELLKDWTGGECRCEKCRKERAQMQSNDEEYQSESGHSIIFPRDDPNDRDYEEGGEDSDDIDDTDSEDDAINEAFRNPSPPNRYASKESLLENHPTVRSLKRNKPIWERHVLPFDYDNDVYRCKSPTSKRKRLDTAKTTENDD